MIKLIKWSFHARWRADPPWPPRVNMLALRREVWWLMKEGLNRPLSSIQGYPGYIQDVSTMFLCTSRLPSFAPWLRNMRGSTNQNVAGYSLVNIFLQRTRSVFSKMNISFKKILKKSSPFQPKSKFLTIRYKHAPPQKNLHTPIALELNTKLFSNC